MWSRGSIPGGHSSVRATGRREERHKLELNARIYGTDAHGKPFDISVMTADASAGGALLVNVNVALRVGEVFGLKYRDDRSRFRVQWLSNVGGDSHPLVGVQCLDPAKNLFGVEARPAVASTEQRAIVKRHPGGIEHKAQVEKRTSFRHSCDLGVQLRVDDSNMGLWARCTDLSEGGCYISTRSPLPANTKFLLLIFIQPQTLEVNAVVRTVFPSIGMGVQFLFASDAERERIKALILSMFSQPDMGGPDNATDAVAPTAAEVHCVEMNELVQLASSLRDWAATASLNEDQRLELEKIARSVRLQLVAARKRIEDGDV